MSCVARLCLLVSALALCGVATAEKLQGINTQKAVEGVNSFLTVFTAIKSVSKTSFWRKVQKQKQRLAHRQFLHHAFKPEACDATNAPPPALTPAPPSHSPTRNFSFSGTDYNLCHPNELANLERHLTVTTQSVSLVGNMVWLWGGWIAFLGCTIGYDGDTDAAELCTLVGDFIIALMGTLLIMPLSSMSFDLVIAKHKAYQVGGDCYGTTLQFSRSHSGRPSSAICRVTDGREKMRKAWGFGFWGMTTNAVWMWQPTIVDQCRKKPTQAAKESCTGLVLGGSSFLLMFGILIPAMDSIESADVAWENAYACTGATSTLVCPGPNTCSEEFASAVDNICDERQKGDYEYDLTAAKTSMALINTQIWLFQAPVTNLRCYNAQPDAEGAGGSDAGGSDAGGGSKPNKLSASDSCAIKGNIGWNAVNTLIFIPQAAITITELAKDQTYIDECCR